MYNFFKSRKFWLGVLGVAVAIIQHYFDIPQDIFVTVEAFLVSLIMGIAIEDAGAKSAGNL